MSKKRNRPNRFDDPEYGRWRTAVMKRDRYACRTCGSTGPFLHAHHIKSYARFPALRLDVDNGIVLCRTCHTKIHSDIRSGRPKKRPTEKTRKKISESLKKYHARKKASQETL